MQQVLVSWLCGLHVVKSRMQAAAERPEYTSGRHMHSCIGHSSAVRCCASFDAACFDAPTCESLCAVWTTGYVNNGASARHMHRVGQNRIYILYMTVYLVIFLPTIPYINRIYMVLANSTHAACSKQQGGLICMYACFVSGSTLQLFHLRAFQIVRSFYVKGTVGLLARLLCTLTCG
jgi:hypothetical protein